MAQLVGKYAAKKLLSGELKKYAHKEPSDQYDPYYTYIDDPKNPGQMKKVKKQIPDYLSDHDAMILAKVRKRAYWLDCSLFSFLGQRFGVSSVVGIIPFIGDGADATMAFVLVYRNCTKIEGGLPANVRLNMLINIFLDFVVGLIPFLGDVLDAMFRANSRNVRVLENYLDKKYKPKELKEREARRKKERRASGRRYESPPPASVLEDMSDQPIEFDGPRTESPPPITTAPAVDDHSNRKQKKGGWFSGGRGGQRTDDLETGRATQA